MRFPGPLFSDTFSCLAPTFCPFPHCAVKREVKELLPPTSFLWLDLGLEGWGSPPILALNGNQAHIIMALSPLGGAQTSFVAVRVHHPSIWRPPQTHSLRTSTRVLRRSRVRGLGKGAPAWSQVQQTQGL